MKDKIEKKLDYIEAEIAEHNARLDALTAEVRESAAKYDAYSIVTFLPGKIEAVKYEHDKIRELTEQKRMLVWMLAV